MQSEEKYDDLTALFEAQDAALESEAFVDRVMQPIRKRSRWRGPLLFGAGGVGVGAALSQIGGLFDIVSVRAASLTHSLDEVRPGSFDVASLDPLWIGAVVVMLTSCVAIVATERN
jgi:hypothetical protein